MKEFHYNIGTFIKNAFYKMPGQKSISVLFIGYILHSTCISAPTFWGFGHWGVTGPPPTAYGVANHPLANYPTTPAEMWKRKER